MRHLLLFSLAGLLCATLQAASSNTVPVVVDGGPVVGNVSVGIPNWPYTSVTICVPGTSNCQTIDHVLVDTGSVGLRLVGSEVTLTLPAVKDSAGLGYANCETYADGTYQWGPVLKADIKLGGEVAPNVPLQVAGQAGFVAPPNSCSHGHVSGQTVEALGAK